MAISTGPIVPLSIVHAARDPSLIKGIYNYCDQWCMYCPATKHCLVFRCDPVARGESPSGDHAVIEERMMSALQVARAFNAAEGRLLPELEAVIDGDVHRMRRYSAMDDPLNARAMRYVMAASQYLAGHPDFPFEMRHRGTGPTAFEVFAWYRVLIGVRIHRAIISQRALAAGEEGFLLEDVLFSARTALVGIERSQAAVAELRATRPDPELERLGGQLRRLLAELDARFPEARTTERTGLDGRSGRVL